MWILSPSFPYLSEFLPVPMIQKIKVRQQGTKIPPPPITELLLALHFRFFSSDFFFRFDAFPLFTNEACCQLGSNQQSSNYTFLKMMISLSFWGGGDGTIKDMGNSSCSFSLLPSYFVPHIWLKCKGVPWENLSLFKTQ